jgi:hypothetical protein
VQPLTRGGAPFDPSNLQTLCRPCLGRVSRQTGPGLAVSVWHEDVVDLVAAIAARPTEQAERQRTKLRVAAAK